MYADDFWELINRFIIKNNENIPFLLIEQHVTLIYYLRRYQVFTED